MDFCLKLIEYKDYNNVLEVYIDAINTIAISKYSKAQLNAWSSLAFIDETIETSLKDGLSLGIYSKDIFFSSQSFISSLKLLI